VRNSVRLIPRLDIKGPHLVKGIHLEGLRVLGRPEQFARRYYEEGADELIYMDVVASLYNRNSLRDIVERTAREVFIPLTVGGGLRTLEDIRVVLQAGADKVSLNTAAVKNPDIVSDAARRFGSSTIVVSIEAIRQPDGRYLAYTDNGREHTGLDALDWAKRVEALGAGELLITSIDREGTGEGYDLELTRAVATSVGIPVIAGGGAGTADHVARAVTEGAADAVAVASILHYEAIRRLPRTAGDAREGNLSFLDSGRSFSKIVPTDLAGARRALASAGVPCRRPAGEGADRG